VFEARGIGNGWLLPAGPLREPWPRRVDLVLRSEAAVGVRGGFVVRRALALLATRADGERMPLADLQPPVHALAGIANPDSFFTMLRAAGVPLAQATGLPDHHDFDTGEAPAGATLVCTEKDAVKLWRRRPDAWAVPLQVDIAAGFWPALDRLLEAKLSSRDGSPTA
jgi:tetraacyldisaccharide 4'-kinase